MSSGLRGVLAIILAFTIWGLFPIYWRLLREIPSIELIYIRLMLTAGACLLLMPMRGSWNQFKAAWRQPRLIGRTFLAALLLSGNWFSFIWAVNNGRVLESSLGYFLCPLASVLLARFVLQERLGWQRWVAVGLATAGVLYLIFQAGRFPLAALAIALTWSSYGLMKKRSRLGPVVGLGLETSLLSPLAAGLLVVMAFRGPLGIETAAVSTYGTLALAGFLTAAPLLLFAYAAQRIQLSTMGMGQYIVPTTHFGLAWYYGEAIQSEVLVGFGLIWLGLIVYAAGRSKAV